MASRTTKFNQIVNSIQIVLTSLAIASSAIIQDEIILIPGREFLSILLLTIFLLTVVEFLKRYVVSVFNQSGFIRKVILREEYFEGLWIDYTNDNVALIKVEFHNGEYLVKGESYNYDGNFIGNWNSDFSEFENGVFKYLHNSNYNNDNSNRLGYSEYSFLNNMSKPQPNQFVGYFIDIDESSRKIRVQGEKIVPEISRLLINKDAKREFVKQYISILTNEKTSPDTDEILELREILRDKNKMRRT